MNIGIYKIVNTINNKCYIGSSIRLEGRKKRHFSELNCNIHHSIALQRAVNKYGLDNFVFEVVEYCNKEDLLIKEQHYIDTLKPEYNTCKIAGNCMRIIKSKEVIDKIRQANILAWKNKELKTPFSQYSRSKIKESNKLIREQNEKRNLNIVEDIKIGLEQKEIANKYQLSKSFITTLKQKNNIIVENNSYSGSKNGFSKLNEQQVKEIKYLLKDKVKQRIVATKFNVKVSTIKAINSGQNWSNVLIEEINGL